jgi:hypothetical protein
MVTINSAAILAVAEGTSGRDNASIKMIRTCHHVSLDGQSYYADYCMAAKVAILAPTDRQLRIIKEPSVPENLLVEQNQMYLRDKARRRQ